MVKDVKNNSYHEILNSSRVMFYGGK